MGYSGLEGWGCSDGAADARGDVIAAMAKSLEKELKDAGNNYNTPGCVNVALILEDKKLFGNLEDYELSYFSDVAKKAKKQIDALVEAINEDLTDPLCDVSVKLNGEYHRKNFKRMSKSLTKFIDGDES